MVSQVVTFYKESELEQVQPAKARLSLQPGKSIAVESVEEVSEHPGVL